MDVGLDLRKAYEEGYEEGYQLGTVHGMNACTDEEFKAEAKRRGYNLIKKPEPVKLLPCVCGRKRIGSWFTLGRMHFYKCETCGLSAAPGTNERHAKVNWNVMIEGKMKDATD